VPIIFPESSIVWVSFDKGGEGGLRRHFGAPFLGNRGKPSFNIVPNNWDALGRPFRADVTAP